MPKKQWKVSQPETQLKSADADEWVYMNPILGVGEPGYVLDEGVLKIGDGKTRFADLPSISTGGGEVAPFVGNPIIVINHGDDPNFPRPDGIEVGYWLGSVEPLNSIEEDLWSGEVDVP